MRICVAAMMGCALALAGPRLAGAEVSEVRIVAQNGSNYLPLFVMHDLGSDGGVRIGP